MLGRDARRLGRGRKRHRQFEDHQGRPRLRRQEATKSSRSAEVYIATRFPAMKDAIRRPEYLLPPQRGCRLLRSSIPPAPHAAFRFSPILG